jgi:hypothetical protein
VSENSCQCAHAGLKLVQRDRFFGDGIDEERTLVNVEMAGSRWEGPTGKREYSVVEMLVYCLVRIRSIGYNLA